MAVSRHIKMRSLIMLHLMILVFLSGCQQQDTTETGKQKKRSARPHLVEISTIQAQQFTFDRQYTGSIKSLRRVEITSRETGRLLSLPFHAGDHVKKGTQLFEIDDELLQRELAKSKASLSQARQELNRLNKLKKKNLVSEDKLLAAKTTLSLVSSDVELLKTRLSYTTEQAPFDGVITHRYAEAGDIIPQYTPLLAISDPLSLAIILPVSELILDDLEIGDKVSIQIDALGSKVLSGSIQRIYPEVDPLTRRGTIEIKLNVENNTLFAGQFARVRIPVTTGKIIAIPFRSLQRETEGEFVYLLNAENKAVKNKVISGRRINSKIEILQGLSVGDKIITRGFLGLKNNKKVTVVNEQD